MNKLYESKYHRLETNYWLFIARRDAVINLIKKVDIGKTDKILDIGCSGGPLINLLKENGFMNIYGIDISVDAINLCKKRGINNVTVMDGTKTLYKDGEFDTIIASDILEHLKDEDSALSEWYRLLKPNGKLILSVPALNSLWSGHDEINGHYRRYNKSSLIKRLEKAQFKLHKISYWNFTLFFPIYVLSMFQHLLPKNKSALKDRLYELCPLINGTLVALLKTENFFLKYINYPVGISIFTVWRK
ncbi:class I SAM-dependent methyltransferase [Candidatus Parcubacteria bacterium]|nr:class I SAM-dependent methyltransferase [Patescibacteria group bacterium]MCG2689513.1 class I SAM-dependent methyltransferase [Candidatus Parcubacteria bacterium]